MQHDRPPQVLAPQPSIAKKDVSSAHRYGSINYIFADPTYQPSQEPGRAMRYVRQAAMDFDPDHDHVLFLGGDPVGAVMLGAALAQAHPGRRLRMLRWERERDTQGRRIPGAGFYVPTDIPL
jgi:hypothetical protein